MLPGEALSLLVIARLPFAVPTEPVFAARSAMYDDPFAQYAVPQAVLRFKQGFGRLIRTKTDRGVVVVLDRRIVSKKYGSSVPGGAAGLHGAAGDAAGDAGRWWRSGWHEWSVVSDQWSVWRFAWRGPACPGSGPRQR